ncbi:hypothetical protein [Lysinibacillus sp. SGAir0095]|nr:hypothetical protein [Lysinibacillus sp. SGAir0095]
MVLLLSVVNNIVRFTEIAAKAAGIADYKAVEALYMLSYGKCILQCFFI